MQNTLKTPKQTKNLFKPHNKKKPPNWVWWYTALIRRQRQVDHCKFQTRLVYRLNSRTVRDTLRNPVLEKKKEKKKKKGEGGEGGERENISILTKGPFHLSTGKPRFSNTHKSQTNKTIPFYQLYSVYFNEKQL